MAMTTHDLTRAHALLFKVNEINKTVQLMKHQNRFDWVLGVRQNPPDGSVHSAIEPAWVAVPCIGLTPIIRFLEAERANFIKELDNLGVETKGLDKS